MAHQLNAEEREVISTMRAAGHSQAEIARTLKRHPSTIYRELKRNSFREKYVAVRAQQFAERRHREAREQSRKMERPETRDYVQSHLKEYWSPEQIAGRLRREFPDAPRRHVSRQTIYCWIKSSPNRLAELRPYLRGKRYRGGRRRPTPREHTIAARPEVINDRQRYGDWEGDTIIGQRRGGGALVSLVERRSGYLELDRVDNTRADTVTASILQRLKPHPQHLRLSCTFDNGAEFTQHAQLHEKLGLDIYFANPHSPWQRGTNENTNGLIRQFFPKGTPFRGQPRSEILRVATLINERPRKRLGYRTPAEVFIT